MKVSSEDLYKESFRLGNEISFVYPGKKKHKVPCIIFQMMPLHQVVLINRDENGSDTNGYHSYYICFHISVRIRIRTRIAFGYIYEYGLTRLRIRIMSIEYGMNRIRRRSDTNIYSDIE